MGDELLSLEPDPDELSDDDFSLDGATLSLAVPDVPALSDAVAFASFDADDDSLAAGRLSFL